MEGAEAGRSVLGNQDRPRSPRLAHRMLLDGDQAPRPDARYPSRRRRSYLSAPRERDCAIGIAHWKAIRTVLGTRALPADRGRQNVEIARQLLHLARPGADGSQAVLDP